MALQNPPSPQIYSPNLRAVLSDDLYSDARTHSAYNGPSRQARLSDIAKAGWLARGDDGSSCVAVGQACRFTFDQYTAPNAEMTF